MILLRKLEWSIEKRKLKELKFIRHNPRQLNEREAKEFLLAVKEFSQVEIPVIDPKNQVLAGFLRVQALKKLCSEEEEIDVRVANRNLTEKEAKEYLLQSNYENLLSFIFLVK